MKRFLICILALVLILPYASAGADTNPMRSLRLETAADGDVLDVRFYADMEYPNQTTAFESIDFVLTYDQTVLKPIELVKTGSVPQSDILDSSFLGIESMDVAGTVEYHAASATGSRGSGLLLHLRFEIRKDEGYGFRLKRDGYSVYDSASGQSQSFKFALLRTEGTVSAGTPVPEPDLNLDQIKPNENPTVEKNWFIRLMESIFGSSCSRGN